EEGEVNYDGQLGNLQDKLVLQGYGIHEFEIKIERLNNVSFNVTIHLDDAGDEIRIKHYSTINLYKDNRQIEYLIIQNEQQVTAYNFAQYLRTHLDPNLGEQRLVPTESDFDTFEVDFAQVDGFDLFKIQGTEADDYMI